MIEILESDVISPVNDLNEDFFKWNLDDYQVELEKYSDQYSVLRHKIVSSPIIHAIYKFKYRLNKPLEGLELENSEDDGFILTKKMLKDLQPVDPDSFGVDDFDDLESEMLKYTSKEIDQDKNKEIEMDLDEEDPILEEVLVTIQNSSIKINNESVFEFSSTIRSSELLPGQIIKEGIYDEDSLLITLTNGFFLLIKFYLYQSEVKPYVVQWWKTSNNEKELPELSDVGRDIIAHSSGSAAYLTSMEGLIRLYYFTSSTHGLMIDRLQNLSFDGTILNSCLIEAINSKAFIFTMVMTSQRRFLIRLFEWWLDESRIIEHTPFLLNSNFPLPILTIPLDDSILLIMQDRFILIEINQILCANNNFLEIPYDGSFPVNYFKSKNPLFTKYPEVFISTEDGTIYMINIIDNKIQCESILKIPKITNFLVEKVDENTIDLLFSSDLSNGGYYRYENFKINHDKSIFPKPDLVIDRWINWAPLFDVEIIKKGNNDEEIWLAHGKSLSKFKIGIQAEKLINDSSLKTAENVFIHRSNSEIFFIFSFVDKTLVFKLSQDELIDVNDSGLELIQRTLLISNLDDICFQITENSIIISDFQNKFLKKKFEDEEIIFADCIDNLIVLFTEFPNEEKLNLSLYKVFGEIKLIGSSIKLIEQPNFLKFFKFNEIVYVVIGLEDNLLIYEVQEELVFIKKINIGIKEPNDFIFKNDLIYISSRFGEFYVFRFNKEEIDLIKTFEIKLTNEPITFKMNENFIILISKFIWKLEFDSNFPTQIIINEQRDRNIYNVLILDDLKMALLREDGFCLSSLSINSEPILKSIKMNFIVKKVKYLSHLKLFAILSENNLMFSNKYKQLIVNFYSKFESSSSLFEKEVPLCINEWILPSEKKSFRNILVGCNNINGNGGALKILQAKLNNDEVDVFELFNLKTTGAVLSINQLNEEIIIYSSSYELYIVSYNFESKKLNESKLIKEFDSIILNIDINKDKILISTKDYSMTILQFINNEFIEIEKDPLIRKITNSLLLKDNVTITTDKLNCSITGVQNNQNRFRTNVSFVPKLKKCEFLPRWYNDKLIRFIAYGMSGDIQLFTLLDKNQTSQFKSIYKKSINVENVCEKGFWEINEGPWSNDRSINTFDHDKFLTSTKELKDLTNSVSI